MPLLGETQYYKLNQNGTDSFQVLPWGGNVPFGYQPISKSQYISGLQGNLKTAQDFLSQNKPGSFPGGYVNIATGQPYTGLTYKPEDIKSISDLINKAQSNQDIYAPGYVSPGFEKFEPNAPTPSEQYYTPAEKARVANIPKSLGGTGTATTPTPAPVSTYQGESIVDYLNSVGQASDFASRAILAKQQGIANYKGTADQNIQLLQSLRSRQPSVGGGAPSLITSTTAGMQANKPPAYNMTTGLLTDYGRSQGLPEVNAPKSPTPTPTTPPVSPAPVPQPPKVEKSPQTIVSEIHQASLNQTGVSTVKAELDRITTAYTDLQNEKNDKIQEINNNPWYSEGVRLAKLRQLDAKYENKELILSNKLKLTESLYTTSREDAKFLTGQAIDVYKQNQLFDQQTVIRGLELAEKISTATTPDITEYNLAVKQGYDKDLIDWLKEQANLKERIARAGAPTTTLPTTQDLTTKESSEALGTVNSILGILDNPNFQSAFGIIGLGKSIIPNTPEYTIAAQVQQVKDKLALAARGLLKGQGAVSNFEALMLANAQTSLKTGMNPADARQELINIAGALATSTGGRAKVQLKDKSGNIYTLMSNSREITKAIADGLKVKYIE
jgi:hypothetical protein